MANFQVFDPTTEAKEQALAYVPRPDSIRNLRIGLVENTKYNSDTLLLKIAALLEQEYGASSHILTRKHNSSVPAHQEIIDEIKANCDVVVAGVGDWGSCSSGSVLDGIVFEKHGIPAASIITDVFDSTGRAMAVAWGLPNYKYLAMPHPIANLTEAEIDSRAREIVPQIVDLLLEGQG